MKEDKSFVIEVTVNGKPRQIQVQADETTDGIAFYKCSVNDKEITQIRKEGERWEQLWGEINSDEVTAIGKAIEAYLDKDRITS